LFFGWWVVAATFVLAAWSSGFGLYGLSVYLVELRTAHQWSTFTISSAITGYYLTGALLMVWLDAAIRRFGQRPVAVMGIAAMAAGVFGLTAVREPWQLQVALAVMALGWSATSSAAINIVLAPWFVRKRGLAVSVAMAGAPAGGFLVVPVLVTLIGQFGFRAGTGLALAGMMLVLVPCIVATVGRKPADLGLEPDGLPVAPAGKSVSPVAHSAASGGAVPGRLEALRTVRYWTLSIAFAIALAAQVGVLTHLVAYLTPIRGSGGAAFALALTSATALVGRLALGFHVDRLPLRQLSTVVFLAQALGLTLIAAMPAGPGLYAGCLLFGLGVGNVVTLPGLLVQREFLPGQFAGVLSLVAATNQVTFAFGPGLLGLVHDASGGYPMAFGLAALIDTAAAVVVLMGARAKETAVPSVHRS